MDYKTGAPDHIEDILIKLHTGQWFGWSDASNKIYSNLVIHDDQYDKPSQASLLRDSDWTAVTDSALGGAEQTAWAEYRQELRDIPQTYDDAESVVWPDAPE